LRRDEIVRAAAATLLSDREHAAADAGPESARGGWVRKAVEAEPEEQSV